MKLYATVTSERGGREARKGGDGFLKIELRHGNAKHAEIWFHAGDGSIDLIGQNGWEKTFSPFDIGHN